LGLFPSDFGLYDLFFFYRGLPSPCFVHIFSLWSSSWLNLRHPLDLQGRAYGWGPAFSSCFSPPPVFSFSSFLLVFFLYVLRFSAFRVPGFAVCTIPLWGSSHCRGRAKAILLLPLSELFFSPFPGQCAALRMPPPSSFLTLFFFCFAPSSFLVSSFF